jgi:hypothetical protein
VKALPLGLFLYNPIDGKGYGGFETWFMGRLIIKFSSRVSSLYMVGRLMSAAMVYVHRGGGARSPDIV